MPPTWHYLKLMLLIAKLRSMKPLVWCVKVFMDRWTQKSFVFNDPCN